MPDRDAEHYAPSDTTELSDQAADPLPPVSEVARLLVITGREAGQSFRIGAETTIGRDISANVRIRRNDVSRKHAVIRKSASGQYVIEDLGSRNGTSVNGVPVARMPIRFGDKIRIGGSTILLFSYENPFDDQLLQAQKLESLGRLAGGVAHDFNNLLAVIMTNVSYLQAMPAGSSLELPEVSDCLETAMTAAKRAGDLTEQLLRFARRSEHHESLVETSQVAHDVLHLLERTFKPNIEIRSSIQDRLHVVGDRTQLEQLLMNLCLNARDAMPGGGALSLTIGQAEATDLPLPVRRFLRPAAHVVLTVSDTGCGMDPATTARIFEPFFTTKGVGHGTGLGLSTVYGIVQRHHGHIEVESAVGEGTSFRIYLPVAEPVTESTRSGPPVGETAMPPRNTSRCPPPA